MQKQFSYKKEDIYKASNKGLDIINEYYPKSVGLDGKNTHFKIRENDKTASANLYFSKTQNCWCVKDWGDKMLSPIDVVMLEDSLTFKEAISQLAAKYNLSKHTPEHLKPIVEVNSAKKGVKAGDFKFVFSKKIPENALQVLGVLVKQHHCDHFYLKHVSELHYTYTDKTSNALKTLVKKSTEKYPIFAYDHKDWFKTYEPLSEKKGDRFRFYGSKPTRFIFGLEQIEKRIIEKRSNNDNDEDPLNIKLDNAIIVSGGSDAINVFSLNENNNLIWYNSESEQIEAKELGSLLKDVKNVYHIPDADATGETKAIELANKFIIIKNIWLPKKLLIGNDWRGKKLKDIKDLITKHHIIGNPDHVIKLFEKLYYSALPFQIWDAFQNKSTKRWTYKLNTKQAVVFLSKNGFYKVESENKDKKSVNDRYFYIHKKNNVVSITNQVEIKDYVNNFIEDKNAPIGVKNLILDTTKLSEKTLQQLPLIKLDFNNATKNSQYKHFKNGVLKITANGIDILKTKDVEFNVWEHNILQRNISVLDPMFKIDITDPDACKIDVLNNDCWFFNYLINTSRVHWFEEYENTDANYKIENRFQIKGQNLTTLQQQEQQQHLINKIFALGYYCHRYKKHSKAWYVLAMDNAINDLSGSGNGGSGKSLTWELAVKEWFPSTVIINGDEKVLSDKHAFENVTENTEAIVLADTYNGFSIREIFEKITGDFDVNPKGKKVYSVPFLLSGKLAGTTNFEEKELSGSKSRRLLPALYSDYYHSTNEKFKTEHSVRDDFEGNDLFSLEFPTEQWNGFYNFIAQCISFYLGCEHKIMPPMENFYKRTSMRKMGKTFFEWANDYFNKNLDKLNTEISRPEIYKNYKEDAGKYHQTPQKFKQNLIEWCVFNDYKFNDPDHIQLDSSGRRIIKVNGVNEEMFYIAASLNADQQNEIKAIKKQNVDQLLIDDPF